MVGMTRSGVLRRKAPSLWRKDVICLREPCRSAMRRIFWSAQVCIGHGILGQLIPNPVTESAMEMEPLTAAHKVARIGSKRLESKAMLV